MYHQARDMEISLENVHPMALKKCKLGKHFYLEIDGTDPSFTISCSK
jgi:hypothetical protein